MSNSSVNQGFEDRSIEGYQFSKYFCNSLLSDVTFIVGSCQKRIPGHKIILTHCSYEFLRIFSDAKVNKEEIVIEDVEEKDFLDFLNFFYTGQIKMADIDVWPVYKLAHRFHVALLVAKCETYLSKSVTIRNCLEFLTKSSFLSEDSKVKTTILRVIEDNFTKLPTEKGQTVIINDLPRETLREIVDLDNLKCDEMEIFNSAMNWAKYNCVKLNISSDTENLRRILGDVLYRIRFPTMKPDWFEEIILEYPNLFTTEEFSDILMEKSSLIFSHQLRKRGFAFVRNPEAFDSWYYMKIKCYPGSFQLSNDTSSEMSIKFKSDFTRTLLGFAFIAKRKNLQPKIVSCKLNKRNVKTNIIGDKVLSWDYSLVLACFEKDETLTENKWNELYCKLDGEMVNVTSEAPTVKDVFNTRGLDIKEGKHNIIPYIVILR